MALLHNHLVNMSLKAGPGLPEGVMRCFNSLQVESRPSRAWRPLPAKVAFQCAALEFRVHQL